MTISKINASKVARTGKTNFEDDIAKSEKIVSSSKCLSASSKQSYDICTIRLVAIANGLKFTHFWNVSGRLNSRVICKEDLKHSINN